MTPWFFNVGELCYLLNKSSWETSITSLSSFLHFVSKERWSEVKSHTELENVKPAEPPPLGVETQEGREHKVRRRKTAAERKMRLGTAIHENYTNDSSVLKKQVLHLFRWFWELFQTSPFFPVKHFWRICSSSYFYLVHQHKTDSTLGSTQAIKVEKWHQLYSLPVNNNNI